MSRFSFNLLLGAVIWLIYGFEWGLTLFVAMTVIDWIFQPRIPEFKKREFE